MILTFDQMTRNHFLTPIPTFEKKAAKVFNCILLQTFFFLKANGSGWKKRLDIEIGKVKLMSRNKTNHEKVVVRGHSCGIGR